MSSMLPAAVSDVRFSTLGKVLSDCKDGSLGARLQALGLEAAKTASFAEAANRLITSGVDPSTRATAFWVPGRVEVMGKHTDYCAGRSLLCAVSRGFAIVCTDRKDANLHILATFELSGAIDEATVPITASSADQDLPEGWARYPAAAARRLARNFGVALGCDVALSCDLPEASGMSSSSAVIILSFLALAARNGLADNPDFLARLPCAEDLCHYLGCIENGQSCGPELPGDAGVGTFGGSEDHTAILLCEPGMLAQYAFCPTRLETTIPFPRGLTMLLAVSGATAQKGAERLRDYNDAAMLARWAASAALGAAANGAHASASASDARPPPKKAAKVAEGTVAAHPPPDPQDAAKAPATTLAAVVASEAARLECAPLDARVVFNVGKRIASVDDGTYAPNGAAPAGSLVRRFKQFYEESEQLVPWVAEAIRRDDREALGSLVDRSQELTETHLRNTLEETECARALTKRLGRSAPSAAPAMASSQLSVSSSCIPAPTPYPVRRWLPKAARRLGAVAASAFGAGFGGSVWALADSDAASPLLQAWRSEYAQRFPEREAQARFFEMPTPAPGARCVS